MKYIKIVLICSIFILIAAGCDNSANTNIPQNPSESSEIFNKANMVNSIQIKDFAFAPDVVSAKKGTTIIWTNLDSAKHNVVAEGTPAGNGPKSELLAQGYTYSFTFNTAGTFEYLCEPHPYMKAKVVVL